ncbi:MAG: hypothetical protein V3T17_09830 [Pseudomonadales bacterium]
MKKLAYILLLLCCTPKVFAIESLITHYAKKYGVDPLLLKTISMRESSLSPWAMNFDGEGYLFKSKKQALDAYHRVVDHPWLFKYRIDKKNYHRRYFKTRAQLTQYYNNLNTLRSKWLSKTIPIQMKAKRDTRLSIGEALIRKINTLNTGIGAMQMNYRYHRDKETSVARWLDPDFNISQGAKLFRSLIDKYKDPFVAVAHYHSNTKKYQGIYMVRFYSLLESQLKRKNS